MRRAHGGKPSAALGRACKGSSALRRGAAGRRRQQGLRKPSTECKEPSAEHQARRGCDCKHCNLQHNATASETELTTPWGPWGSYTPSNKHKRASQPAAIDKGSLAHRSLGSMGPSAGSYSPPRTAVFMLSKMMGLTIFLQLILRTWRKDAAGTAAAGRQSGGQEGSSRTVPGRRRQRRKRGWVACTHARRATPGMAHAPADVRKETQTPARTRCISGMHPSNAICNC